MNSVPSPLAARFRQRSRLTAAVRPILNRVLPAKLTLVSVLSGRGKNLILPIYPRTEKYYWTGAHEPVVQEAIASSLRPGMTFWDIGANVGFFTLIAARLVGDFGNVRAFEPLQQNRDRLTTSLAVNNVDNVIIDGCAVSGSSGTATLYASDSPLMWTLVREHGAAEGVSVTCRTLDEMRDIQPAPNVIKIDVEGAELEVLRGGLRFLEALRPRVIVEFSAAAMVDEAKRLLPFYIFQDLTAGHWLLK